MYVLFKFDDNSISLNGDTKIGQKLMLLPAPADLISTLGRDPSKRAVPAVYI